MSHVTCHFFSSLFFLLFFLLFFFFLFLDKVVTLVGGGSVINGATPSSLWIAPFELLHLYFIKNAYYNFMKTLNTSIKTVATINTIIVLQIWKLLEPWHLFCCNKCIFQQYQPNIWKAVIIAFSFNFWSTHPHNGGGKGIGKMMPPFPFSTPRTQCPRPTQNTLRTAWCPRYHNHVHSLIIYCAVTAESYCKVRHCFPFCW